MILEQGCVGGLTPHSVASQLPPPLFTGSRSPAALGELGSPAGRGPSSSWGAARQRLQRGSRWCFFEGGHGQCTHA
jgi:hypothetical protein